MFHCENCGKLVQRNQPINKIVTERRKVRYQNMVPRKRGRDKILKETSGFETVKEINTCPKCFLSLTGKTPRKGYQKTNSRHTKYKHELRQPAKFNKTKDKNISVSKQQEVEVVTHLKVETN